MKSVLITGGAGCIGSRFVPYWRARHPSDHLIIIDLLTYPRNRANVHKIADATFVQGDLGNARLMDMLLQQFSTSRRDDCAAEDHELGSLGALDARLRTNVNGTRVLLDAARLAWAGKEQDQYSTQTPAQEICDGVAPDTFPSARAGDRASHFQFLNSIEAPARVVRAYRRTYDVSDAEPYRSDGHGHGHFLCLENSVPLLIRDAIHKGASSMYGGRHDARNWLDADGNCQILENVLLSGCVGAQYCIGKDSDVTNVAIVHTLCAVLDNTNMNTAPSYNAVTHSNRVESPPYSVTERFGSSHRVRPDEDSSVSLKARLLSYSEYFRNMIKSSPVIREFKESRWAMSTRAGRAADVPIIRGV